MRLSRIRLTIYGLIALALAFGALFILGHQSARAEKKENFRSRSEGTFSAPVILLTQSFPADPEIIIEIDKRLSGELEIRSGRVSQAQIELVLIYETENSANAQRLHDAVEVSLSDSHETVDFELTIDRSIDRIIVENFIQVEIKIEVPEGVKVEIFAPRMETEIRGPAAKITISEPTRRVSVIGARGALRIESAKAPLEIRDFIGVFQIETSGAELVLHDIEIKDTIGKPARLARAVNSDGDIEISRYSGPLFISTSTGIIRGDEISLRGSRNSIRNQGGPIDIEFTEIQIGTEISIKNRSEDIKLTFPSDISSRFELRFSDKDLVIFEDIEHMVERVRSSNLLIKCGAGESKISVAIRDGGSIKIGSN
ncbi:MAG: hypothetical protein IIB00_01460 [candidate division Zixibacteria bacterium]|nr:hypothetical protein [candidate division Zixibacteria bacterium]